MPLRARAWIGTAIAGACFVLHFFWPPAAGFGVIGVLVASLGIFALNVPSTQAAQSIAALLYAAGLVRASGSMLLGLAVLVAAIPTMPNDVVVRRLGYKSSWVLLLVLPVALLLAALAWRAGFWLLSAAPLFVFLALGAASMSQGLAAFKRLARPAWRVKIGEIVPDFTLKDRRGESEFRLSDHRGKHVLIAFLVGDWCPVCHVKMRIYQREAANLAKHHVTLAVVSPSAGAEAVSFANEVGLDLMVLADPENTVAALFDAVNPKAGNGRDIPLPASFLVDPDGKLAHASRPDDLASFLDPAAVLRFIEKGATARVAA